MQQTNKPLFDHFSTAMNMHYSAQIVVIAFVLYIFHPSIQLQATEINWHNLKYSYVTISIFKQTDNSQSYQNSTGLSQRNLLFISKLRSQGLLADAVDFVSNL